MKRYIFTGAPGAGKTTLLNALADRGYTVIPEAATDIIRSEQARGVPEPWQSAAFIEQVATLQHQRQIDTVTHNDNVQLFDRSPICTLALCQFLEIEVPAMLSQEIERIQAHTIYQRTVFFVANLGFVVNNDIRQISLEDALRFEQLHIEVYRSFGYHCEIIPKGLLEGRLVGLLNLLD